MITGDNFLKTAINCYFLDDPLLTWKNDIKDSQSNSAPLRPIIVFDWLVPFEFFHLIPSESEVSMCLLQLQVFLISSILHPLATEASPFDHRSWWNKIVTYIYTIETIIVIVNKRHCHVATPGNPFIIFWLSWKMKSPRPFIVTVWMVILFVGHIHRYITLYTRPRLVQFFPMITITLTEEKSKMH